MKLALMTLFCVLAGCSIKHASDSYTCDDTTPCGAGRICDNGYCVLSGSIDASMNPIDGGRPDGGGNNCPTGCTSCSTAQKTCTIDCSLTSCTNTVTCPQGYSCDILCNTDNSCRNGINCTKGTDCTIECSGKSSCQNVQCGAGPCDVSCTGTSSCRGVACENSCACDVACDGTQACEGIQCTAFACRTLDFGCTSQPDVCHSCQ